MVSDLMVSGTILYFSCRSSPPPQGSLKTKPFNRALYPRHGTEWFTIDYRDSDIGKIVFFFRFIHPRSVIPRKIDRRVGKEGSLFSASTEPSVSAVPFPLFHFADKLGTNGITFDVFDNRKQV